MTKLTVLDIKETRSVGNSKVTDFMAKGEDEKTLKYSFWGDTFGQHIKKDAVIEADVEMKESDKTDAEGNHFINRTIKQIYVDGQPVSVKKPGGFVPRSISPEQQASIEGQVAAKIVSSTIRQRIVRSRAVCLNRNIALSKVILI